MLKNYIADGIYTLMSEKMKVSVICPTYRRPERHTHLYDVFNHQTYEDKELLILDDSHEKSPFFSKLQDDRVKYVFLNSRCSIGHKRNLLNDLSGGELIVHFDDDDFYAPAYIEKMVELIAEADFIKLSKWLAWQQLGGKLWEWDTCSLFQGNFFEVSGLGGVRKFENIDPQQYEKFADLVINNFEEYAYTALWGYGFSYVYRKSLWESNAFQDISSYEDFWFVHQALQSGKICKHTAEAFHLALHAIHPLNNTLIYPQHQLDVSKALELWGEQVRPWLINYETDLILTYES